jgi:hypothetical protein
MRPKLLALAVALVASLPRGTDSSIALAADEAAPDSWAEALRSRRGWWSLQPVAPAAPPGGADLEWASDPIDRFVRSALDAKGLRPAPIADARTLSRRLGLVLTGLAPPSAAAEIPYERLVDSLLASPQFGERWAQHWMDVVRFSETHGNEWNYEVHHAWRYRDYLVRAFNDDLPFDRFVREHVAGDLLEEPRWHHLERFNESVVATAFYRFGEANHDDCIALRSIGFDIADNQIDTLTKAFQATTVACARCHDHKLDAISTRDYHAILGILRSSRLVCHTLDAPEVNAERLDRLRALKASLRERIAERWLADAAEVERHLGAALARRAPAPGGPAAAAGLDAGRVERWAELLAAKELPMEHPLEPLRSTAAAAGEGPAKAAAHWRSLAESCAREERGRADRNQSEFTTLADFRPGAAAEPCGAWQADGQGLREGPTPSGELVLSTSGERLVEAILPAGRFTHTLSDRLNGSLRSPTLPAGKRHVSFLVLGKRSSALRLVSNNCQLNYVNYRALTSSDLHWVTFPAPEDRESLRTYAELVTLLDNPKFPDQLSALGGDKENYRLPWERAIGDGRSFFGIARAVLHDGPEPPKAELSHLRALFADGGIERPEDLAARYADAIAGAIKAWVAGRAGDDDVVWLDALLDRGLLSNTLNLTPEIAALAREYRRIESELSAPRVAPGLADAGPGADQPVLERGDPRRPGAPVARRYLEVLEQGGAPFSGAGSGRRELAERLASASNPLTARVFVNRIWHHVFGAGLVRTVDDFGRVGELPSHPELLDYLAARFVEDGWSLKRLVRRLVLTRTFRSAGAAPGGAREIDPENRWLSHYRSRRMEAEAIRDAILAASGRLDLAIGGPSVQPYREKENADRRLFPGPLDGGGRRSIYIKRNLMEAPEFLGAFNLPGGKVAQGRRDSSDAPAQALALLNDPLVAAQAEVWAARLIAPSGDSLRARLETVFDTALGRPPADVEIERFSRAADRLAELHGVAAGEVLRSRAVWKDIGHAVFNLKEFITIP